MVKKIFDEIEQSYVMSYNMESIKMENYILEDKKSILSKTADCQQLIKMLSLPQKRQ